MATIDPQLTLHIASLAHIPLSNEEADVYAKGFEKTLTVVDTLQTLPTEGVLPTAQVTDSENVFREDVCTPERMLIQEQALSNAPRAQDGYFVVDGILEES